MADEPGAERLDEQEEEEGGPVKSFLEHLEDLRWVLIKIASAVGVAMLLCLIAGNYVVGVVERPSKKPRSAFPAVSRSSLFSSAATSWGRSRSTPTNNPLFLSAPIVSSR